MYSKLIIEKIKQVGKNHFSKTFSYKNQSSNLFSLLHQVFSAWFLGTIYIFLKFTIYCNIHSRFQGNLSMMYNNFASLTIQVNKFLMCKLIQVKKNSAKITQLTQCLIPQPRMSKIQHGDSNKSKYCIIHRSSKVKNN